MPETFTSRPIDIDKNMAIIDEYRQAILVKRFNNQELPLTDPVMEVTEKYLDYGLRYGDLQVMHKVANDLIEASVLQRSEING